MQDVEPHHTSEAISQAERPDGWVDRSRLLDKPSDPHPILTLLMSEALHRILLTADGRSQALAERVSGSRSASAPKSDLAVILDEMECRFWHCRTHRQRLALIKEAQQTWIRLCFAPKSNIVARGSKEWRQALAIDPRPYRVIQADYRVSAKTIAAARKEFAH